MKVPQPPSKNEKLYDLALQAISNLFGDTSVGDDQTRRNLEALEDEIKIRLASLERHGR